MLHSLAGCRGFSVLAADGAAGSVADVYFDEKTWIADLLMVDPDGWFGQRTVVLSTSLVRAVDWRHRTMHLSLYRRQLEQGAGADVVKPVSRQDEGMLPRWHYSIEPDVLGIDPREDSDRLAWRERKARTGEDTDPYLRSTREVIGYAVQAFDRAAGEVKDFLFDEQGWPIRLMVVNTCAWWPGTDVLVPVTRIAHVNYSHGSVLVDMTSEELRNLSHRTVPIPERAEVKAFTPFGWR